MADLTKIGIGNTTDSVYLTTNGDYTFSTVIDIGKPNVDVTSITIRGYEMDDTSLSSVMFAVSPFSNFSTAVVPVTNYTTATDISFSTDATIGDQYSELAVGDVPSIGRYVKVDVVMADHNTQADSAYRSKVSKIDVNYEYDYQSEIRKMVYAFKTDMFGNQYYLIKSNNGLDIASQKVVDGVVYVRTVSDKIKLLTEYIDLSFLTDGETIIADIASKAKSLEVFYDTLMIVSESYIVIVKCEFDYEAGTLIPIKSKSHVLNVYNPDDYDYETYDAYADLWFSENLNVVDFVNFNDDNAVINPTFYELTLDGKLNELVFDSQTLLDSAYSDELDKYNVIEPPVLTKNPDTDQYHLTFIGRTDLGAPAAINRLILEKGDGKMMLKDVQIVRPVET